MSKKNRKVALQEKREVLILLREKDRREEADVYGMLESELDKEIAWRMDPHRYETSNSISKHVFDLLQRLEQDLKSVK